MYLPKIFKVTTDNDVIGEISFICKLIVEFVNVNFIVFCVL